MAKDAANLLVEFGFTELEAEIYLYLLGASPSTGYGVAKGIKKPAANTYKSLQTLSKKGAILVEEGPTKQVSAVPYSELLDRLEREFAKRQASARKAFRSFSVPGTEPGVYQLSAWEGVVQRATELIVGSSTEVLAVGQLSDLASVLKLAADRGVTVQVAAISAIGLVEEFKTAETGLALGIDGHHVIFAQDSEGLWISKPEMVAKLIAGIRAQIQVAEIVHRLEEGAGGKRIAKVLNLTRPGKAEE